MLVLALTDEATAEEDTCELVEETGPVDAAAALEVADVSEAETRGRVEGVITDVLVLDETAETVDASELAEDAGASGRPEGVMTAELVVEAILERTAVLSALADEAEGTGRPDGVMMTVLEDALDATEESTELTDEAESTELPEADVTAALPVEVDAVEAIGEAAEEVGMPELIDCSLVLVLALEATLETVETTTWLLLSEDDATDAPGRPEGVIIDALDSEDDEAAEGIGRPEGVIIVVDGTLDAAGDVAASDVGTKEGSDAWGLADGVVDAVVATLALEASTLDEADTIEATLLIAAELDGAGASSADETEEAAEGIGRPEGVIMVVALEL